MRALLIRCFCTLGAMFGSGIVLAQMPPAGPLVAWCAPEFETLQSGTCFQASSKAKTNDLVIFLHGVILPNTDWQWKQQRMITGHGKRLDFDVLMPRGRRGIGPKGMHDWWTWPTSVIAQSQVEESLLQEWAASKKRLEQRRKKLYSHTYVVGFSNGAYFATSLALRGKMAVDGYAVFAGGSAPNYLQPHARRTRKRVPLFVGWGHKDSVAKQVREIDTFLTSIHWKHKVIGHKNVGHTVTGKQLTEAFSFLRHTQKPKKPKGKSSVKPDSKTESKSKAKSKTKATSQH
jgi:predicted esterase